jgi:hypothetical protein
MLVSIFSGEIVMLKVSFSALDKYFALSFSIFFLVSAAFAEKFDATFYGVVPITPLCCNTPRLSRVSCWKSIIS